MRTDELCRRQLDIRNCGCLAVDLPFKSRCADQCGPRQAPKEEARPLFLQFAALEENHGLARTAMEVYDRAVRTLPEPERLAVYELYLAKASEFFGIGKARPTGRLFCLCK